MSNMQVIDIGSRRELFVDHYLIDKLDGASLKLHEPRDEGIALQLDRQWEGPYPWTFTVLKDGDLYRMWYRGLYERSSGGGPKSSICYAESSDGVSWTRPNLGLFEVRGIKDNNVVMPGNGTLSPFLDARPGVPSAERYKALSGPRVYVSPDGFHWKKLREEPVMSYDGPAWDSQNVAFWSESEQCYVAHVRTYRLMADTLEESQKVYRRMYGDDGHGWRWIARSTSQDFVNWSEVVDMDFGDTPYEQLYTNGTHPYFRAPHIYVALAKRFMPGMRAIPAEEADKLVPDPGKAYTDTSDSVFFTTRGGLRYDRIPARSKAGRCGCASR